MVTNIHQITECPECASIDIVYNERRQQVVCKTCGLIYESLTPNEEKSYLEHESSVIGFDKVAQIVQKKHRKKSTARNSGQKQKVAKKNRC